MKWSGIVEMSINGLKLIVLSDGLLLLYIFFIVFSYPCRFFREPLLGVGGVTTQSIVFIYWWQIVGDLSHFFSPSPLLSDN